MKAGRNKFEWLFGPSHIAVEKRGKKIQDAINEAEGLLKERSTLALLKNILKKQKDTFK